MGDYRLGVDTSVSLPLISLKWQLAWTARIRSAMGCISSRHGFTSFGAKFAGFGAFLAVFHVVFRALAAARLAGCSAQRADRVSLCAMTGDGGCCQATNIGAFQVQCNAAGHRLWLVFIQASRRTLEARGSTVIAGAKTFNFFLAQHVHFLWSLPKIRQMNHSEIQAGCRCTRTQRID